MKWRRLVTVSTGLVTSAALAVMDAAGPGRRPVTYEEARPVIEAAGAPAEIVAAPAGERDAVWQRVVEARLAEQATRLHRGEEDSLVPLLLFGTSFTAAPRITRAFLENAGAGGSGPTGVERRLAAAFEPRVDDLLDALSRPGTNERLVWARATLERRGFALGTPQGRASAGAFLVQTFARVTRESGELAALLHQGDGDRTDTRAQVFAARGLAPDTSWPINFAVFEALQAAAASGALHAHSVRRVAIVGPGLEFVDKDEGFDYYPPQCVQPFAVLDALGRLSLGEPAKIDVTTFDVNPRVNAHLRALPLRRASRPYEVQLVRRTDVRWTAEASRYFADWGTAVGRAVPPLPPPGSTPALETRAIRVNPTVLRRLRPETLDVVYERLPLAPDARFDLVIATNVLLYYDAFQQGLAARSIEALLRPGGLLLTNTRLDSVPGFPLRRIQQTTHVFSARPGDGETMVAYARGGAPRR